ncbi:hypothetical protein [[Phormidium] sp. ETS-05]|nr:hypothetical protein [[Phormidium] sp. ETS-05]
MLPDISNGIIWGIFSQYKDIPPGGNRGKFSPTAKFEAISPDK